MLSGHHFLSILNGGKLIYNLLVSIGTVALSLKKDHLLLVVGHSLPLYWPSELLYSTFILLRVFFISDLYHIFLAAASLAF